MQTTTDEACTPDTAPTMRTEEEIRTKLADVTERLERADNATACVALSMTAAALKWALGEEVPWP